MKIKSRWLTFWQQVPVSIRKFLIRGLLFFISWKALYILYIGPRGMWDEQLTQATGLQTAATLNLVRATDLFSASKERTQRLPGDEKQFGSVYKSTLQYDGVPVLYIFDSCNGLELLVLYAGFILCYPARGRRKAVFLLAGTPLIFYINVFRCVALAFVALLKPAYLDFAHHYLFKIIVYLSILFLWWFFTAPRTPSSKHPPALA